eukprot:1161200-Pelagomonas_calceolata.AAC.7
MQLDGEESELADFVARHVAPAPRSALALRGQLQEHVRLFSTGCAWWGLFWSRCEDGLTCWMRLRSQDSVRPCFSSSPCKKYTATESDESIGDVLLHCCHPAATLDCSIDDLLGGGVFESSLLELAGESSSGEAHLAVWLEWLNVTS